MILIWVFDGLRPDLVQPALMPRLNAMRQRGAWFSQSYCAFPPVTRVNAATLASGSSPALHGIPGNTLYLRAGAGGRFGSTGDDAVLRGLRVGSAAPLLGAPTLAETLAAHGQHTLVVGTGSPGCAYLLHPEVGRAGGAIWHPAFCEPAGLGARVAAVLGPQPDTTGYSVEALSARVDYAARALSEVLVPAIEPALVIFWCTVPDGLHHRFGLGSPEATAGLHRADATFGGAIDALAERTGNSLDVIVTADHGYATVNRHVDVAGELGATWRSRRHADAWAVTVDGGAAHLFARDGRRPDAALRRVTVESLLEHDWAGAVFAGEETPGALPLAALGIDCARAPDLLVTFAWSDAPNAHGFRGQSPGGGAIAIGAGDHGGAAPFELRNTLLAAGPSFRQGAWNGAAGIGDIAPTVCRLLGVPAPARWDGRVLHEALAGQEAVQTGHAGAESAELLMAGEDARQLWLSLVRRGRSAYVQAAGRGDPAAFSYD